MGEGSREHDLLGEFVMILATWSSDTYRGESGKGRGEYQGRCAGE